MIIYLYLILSDYKKPANWQLVSIGEGCDVTENLILSALLNSAGLKAWENFPIRSAILQMIRFMKINKSSKILYFSPLESLYMVI